MSDPWQSATFSASGYSLRCAPLHTLDIVRSAPSHVQGRISALYRRISAPLRDTKKPLRAAVLTSYTSLRIYSRADIRSALIRQTCSDGYRSVVFHDFSHGRISALRDCRTKCHAPRSRSYTPCTCLVGGFSSR